MLRFACIFGLVACSEGFSVADEDAGRDGAIDSTTDVAADAENPSDDTGTPDAASDTGPIDASADAGPFDNATCPSPWLFFADPTRSSIRRVSLATGSECPELDGGGALDDEVTSVTIAADVFVVASRRQVQGLDPRTNAVVWSIPQEAEPGTLEPRTVVVALEDGFIAAWMQGETLVHRIRVTNPMETSVSAPVDEFFYDLSAADDRRSYWGARSPGERSRRDLTGTRLEERPVVNDLYRIHAFGGRVVSVNGRSTALYIDDLSTPEDTAPEQVNPEDCEWIPFAVPSPLSDDELIVACTRIAAPRGEIDSFRIVDGAGASRPLLVVNSVIWDAELYVP